MLAGPDRLARAKEIRGELLMIVGTKDPHVSDAGRETLAANKVLIFGQSPMAGSPVMYRDGYRYASEDSPWTDSWRQTSQ
jgi:hypothetical protein